jgi:photosystem II stability/assembly factor-like uncharacterized protein
MKTQLLKTIKSYGKAIFLMLVAGFSGLALQAQSWGTQSSTITDDINGISFRSGSDEGMAVADGGRILKTTDGGLTWSVQTSGTVWNLNAVLMITLDSAYIVGDSGAVLVTGNGGATWTALGTGTGERFNDISVMGNKGFIVGDNGAIFRIDGATVTPMTSGVTADLSGVYMVDPATAFVSGGSFLNSTILVTFNTGSVWTQLTSGTINGLNDIWFVNDSTGYAVGDVGTVVKTTDHGSNWSTQVTGASSNMNAVCFITADSGYAVGGGGLVMRTVNGGANWTTLTSGVASALSSVAFPANYEGYAGGAGGTIVKTCPNVFFEVMPNDSICINGGATFTNRSHNGSSYAWVEDGDTVGTNVNYFNMYNTAGVYSMRLEVSNGTCGESYTHSLYVADTPSVNLGPDTTICNTCTITLNAGNPGSDYIWYRDGVATGVVTQTNNVGVAGTYSVKVTTPAGCESWDSVVVTIATGMADITAAVNKISVHPNPNNRQFTLGFTSDSKQTTEVKIVNYLGMSVYNETVADFAGTYNRNISLENFPAGVYFVNVTSNGRTSSIKVIAY